MRHRQRWAYMFGALPATRKQQQIIDEKGVQMKCSNFLLLLVVVTALSAASQIQAATIDPGTSGSWTDTYGEDGYIMPFYNGPLSSWTAPVSTSSDVTSLPGYVTGYSYSVSGTAAGPYGYKWGSSIGESDTRWGGWGSYSLEDPREGHTARECCCIYYDGPITVSLTLAADAPDFQMAIYAYDFGADHDRSETIAVQWQGETAPVDSALLDDYWQGKWAVFNVVPNGQTQMDIIITPTAGTLGGETNLMGIMFSPVPEPDTLILLIGGLLSLTPFVSRRRR